MGATSIDPASHPVLAAYQETMSRFVAVQAERVMPSIKTQMRCRRMVTPVSARNQETGRLGCLLLFSFIEALYHYTQTNYDCQESQDSYQ